MDRKDKTILIVCRGPKGLKALQKVALPSARRCVLASDDFQVRSWAQEHGLEVSWLEQVQSFYQVAPEVLRITEEINAWFQEQAGRLWFVRPLAHLLFWTRHVEGGLTSQKIQDLLLLINSYCHLLELYSPDEVLLFVEPGFVWEDLILDQVVKVAGLSLTRERCLSLSGLWSRIAAGKDLLRFPYHLFHVCWIRLHNRCLTARSGPGALQAREEVHFQLCSSAWKHVQNILPLMQALRKAGLQPVAVCWHSSDRFSLPRGAEQIRAQGFKAVELECCLSWTELFSSFWKSFCFALYLLGGCRKKDFFSKSELTFRGVSLQPALWPYLLLFAVTEFGQRIRLFWSLKRFYQQAAPLAFKLYGGVSLAEGSLAWQVLSAREEPPLFFNYWLGNAIDWPYGPEQEPVDLFLASGQLQKDLVRKNLRIPLSKIAVVGQSRYDHLLEFKARSSREKSLQSLGIGAEFAHYLFFDSGMILRGFMSASEQLQTLEALLVFASTHKDVALLIKPHPGHHPGQLEDLVRHFGLENCLLIDKNVSPYPGLEIADLLVTKFSTLGLEAMFFKTGVLSLILDGDRRWKCFGEAAEYFFDLNTCLDFLERFCSDPAFKKDWLKTQWDKQRSFLQQMLGPGQEPGGAQPMAQAQAEAIIRAIREQKKW